MSYRIAAAGKMIVTVVLVFICSGCVSLYAPPRNFTPTLPSSAKVGVVFERLESPLITSVSPLSEIRDKVDSKIFLALKAKGYEPILLTATIDPSWRSRTKDSGEPARLAGLAHEKGASSLLIVSSLVRFFDRVVGPYNRYVEASHVSFGTFAMAWFDLEENFLYWKPFSMAEVTNVSVDFEDTTVIAKNKLKFFEKGSLLSISGQTETVPITYISEEEWLDKIYQDVLNQIPQYDKK
ncbi:MAG: hypothetical protein H6754_09115 [Candidatus Omnitrophica bacterium]|nr:hypothetical protein [Candidatus Omnitrophota bacterium]